jgi:hypothetical protein
VIEELIPTAFHDTGQYENNRCEADHGRLKARLRPMRGLKTDRTASVVIRGHAFIQNLRRGHYELGVEASPMFRPATTIGTKETPAPVVGCCPAGVWPAGHRKHASTIGVPSTHGRAKPFSLHCPVDGRAGDAEQVSELSGGVLPRTTQSHQVRFLPVIQLGLLATQTPLTLATFIPSLVRSRIRSDSNSATMAW